MNGTQPTATNKNVTETPTRTPVRERYQRMVRNRRRQFRADHMVEPTGGAPWYTPQTRNAAVKPCHAPTTRNVTR